jgi:FHA domain
MTPVVDKSICRNLATANSAERRELMWPMPTDRYMLWIDGVGAWQLCVGTQFLIGGPTLEDKSAEICLMANLSRRHASLLRNGEDWFIHPHNSTVVSGRAVTGPTLLRTGDEICLAERVRLGFRIPSVLTGSALIDFESPHRPAHSVNGIILMTDSILLGPRKDHHVCCPDWPEVVVIYHQDGVLRCRSKASLTINGLRVRDSAVLSDGAVVSGDDFRFRIERLKDR